MPRCGSTLLEQILSSHKEIYGAGELDLLRKILNPVITDNQDKISFEVIALADSIITDRVQALTQDIIKDEPEHILG